MLFTTPIFLFMFLPLTLLLYFIAKDKYKNAILFLASLIFYSWGGAKYLILILILILINYFSGILIDKNENKKRKKIIFITTILINLGTLGYFKYFDFFIANIIKILEIMNIGIANNIHLLNITLPIGISFFTFQILSYIIDVYKGKIKVQKNIINFGLYVMLFPQLIAGPIVRYIDVDKQINERTVTIDKFYAGAKRFMIGFSKKILLSNMAGAIADAVFASAEYNTNMLVAWVGVICYALQIYHDFSGYSDMAIGLGKIFGFDFLENFDYPYISKSIKEFWRRWHISLSTWFRDYVYIPLGGNRNGKFKTYRNLMIVFLITGFWHGASWNFVIWGLFYGIFLILERGKFGEILQKLPTFIQRIYTLVIVLIAWVFFRADGLTNAIAYLQGMFSFNFQDTYLLLLKLFDREKIVFIILAMIFATPVLKKLLNKLKENSKATISITIETMEYTALIIVFIISISYMTGSTYNPFIYFRF